MPKQTSITRTKKRGRGRPPTGAISIHLRVEPDLLDALDRFIASEPSNLSRPEAIRVLLADSLIGLGILQPKE